MEDRQNLSGIAQNNIQEQELVGKKEFIIANLSNRVK